MTLNAKEISETLQGNRYAPTYLVDDNGEIVAALLPGFGFRQKFRAACMLDRIRKEQHH